MSLHRHGLKALIALGAACSYLTACGGGGSNSNESSGSCQLISNAIAGGSSCNDTSTPIAALIIYAGDQPLGSCSGALIASDKILTAAHCLVERGTNRIAVLVGGGLYFGARGDVPPQYSGRAGSPFDLGVLTLDRAVTSVDPLPLLQSDLTAVGESMIVAGYGLDENGISPISFNVVNGQSVVNVDKFKASTVTITDSAPGILAASYDSDGSGICQGDSGGPAMQFVNGQLGVVAVNAFTIAGCSKGSISGFVDLQYSETGGFVLDKSPATRVF